MVDGGANIEEANWESVSNMLQVVSWWHKPLSVVLGKMELGITQSSSLSSGVGGHCCTDAAVTEQQPSLLAFSSVTL